MNPEAELEIALGLGEKCPACDGGGEVRWIEGPTLRSRAAVAPNREVVSIEAGARLVVDTCKLCKGRGVVPFVRRELVD